MLVLLRLYSTDIFLEAFRLRQSTKRKISFVQLNIHLVSLKSREIDVKVLRKITAAVTE